MAHTVIFPTDENSGLASKRGVHFGRAAFYILVTLDENGVVQQVEGVRNPGHTTGQCGSAVQNICQLKADSLVVSGIGNTPLKGFLANNMAVYYDHASKSVEESLAALNAGRLVPMTAQMGCTTHSHPH
jgi:predicted Fe-Mo cluster-binding NifX family protein